VANYQSSYFAHLGGTDGYENDNYDTNHNTNNDDEDYHPTEDLQEEVQEEVQEPQIQEEDVPTLTQVDDATTPIMILSIMISITKISIVVVVVIPVQHPPRLNIKTRKITTTTQQQQQ
jgi:hypothetical protein